MIARDSLDSAQLGACEGTKSAVSRHQVSATHLRSKIP